MEIYKEIFYLVIEMVICVFIIIFGYEFMNNFDSKNVSIAKYYDETKIVQLSYENNIDNSIISIHNVSDKLNNKNIILKINKQNNLENVILDINKINFNLNDLYLREDYNYKYYLIENIDLTAYETKTYYIDFILENNMLLNDYEFITEL